MLHEKLSQMAGYADPITAALQSIAPIISLFRTSPEGRQKIAATADQQAFEKAARQIQDDVFAGRMDPDAAIDGLDDLMGQLNRQGGNFAQSAGAANAGRLIAQIKTIVESKRTQMLGSDDPNLVGSPGFQSDRLRTALRARLQNQPAGERIRETPLEPLFTPAPKPLESLGGVTSRVQELFPNVGQKDRTERLTKRITALSDRGERRY